MMRKDGLPFNRETEQTRWDYVDEFETRLLREKSVHESMADLDMLFERQETGAATAPDPERVEFLAALQMRLRALSEARRGARG